MRSIGRRHAAGALSVLLLGLASMAHAVPVTITDTYGVGSPDVIGNVADFDIQKIVFTSLTSSNVTAEIYLNYHNTTLAPWDFCCGLTLSVGDLIFDVQGVYKYAVPLVNRAVDGLPDPTADAVTAGHLYSVSDFWTSDEKTGGFGLTYRTGQVVQVQHGTDIGTGSVTNVDAGNPGQPTERKVTLTFDPDDAFWSDLSTFGLSVHFASATCGNDVIDGTLAPVPEPGTLLLLGTGFVGMGAALRRRRWMLLAAGLVPDGAGHGTLRRPGAATV